MSKPHLHLDLDNQDLDETTLRDLIPSPYGLQCMHAIVHALDGGRQLRIIMNDGSTRTLTCSGEAHVLFLELDPQQTSEWARKMRPPDQDITGN